MARRRQVDEIEFDPQKDVGEVLAAMDRLAGAHDGWINLLPGVPEDAVEQPSQGVFSALFGTAQPPVSMCTWMPGRRGTDGGPGPKENWRTGETVGIMHPRGRFAVSQLASLGVPVPTGWTVRQDHARRGLIVIPAPGRPHRAVLDWSIAAGEALSMVPLTGLWKARVYLPR